MTLTKFDITALVIIMILVSVSAYLHFRSAPVNDVISDSLGVKDLVQRVKSELVQLEEERLKSNQPALFELSEFKLEIKFVVSEKTTTSGKVEYEVVTVGGDQTFSAEKVQTITINMKASTPVNENAGPSQQ